MTPHDFGSKKAKLERQFWAGAKTIGEYLTIRITD